MSLFCAVLGPPIEGVLTLISITANVFGLTPVVNFIVGLAPLVGQLLGCGA